MQDYIIFGYGYDGDVRQGEDNSPTFRVVKKPALFSEVRGIPPETEDGRLYEVPTNHYLSKEGKLYNVCFTTLNFDAPHPQDIEKAIRDNSVQPI